MWTGDARTEGPKAGLLAEGYDADVIAVDANPLDDITVLADPGQISMVWSGGDLVKDPGVKAAP